ncbi:MAG TPA: hypothetical protein VLJ79_00730 [Candidatus Binatia bacterium]|nr:hypothetical protein [Candidatus Binatia bacterium]
MKKIIILLVGSYRSLGPCLRWGLKPPRLPGPLDPKIPRTAGKQRKMNKEIAKLEMFASSFSRESISTIEKSPLTGNP